MNKDINYRPDIDGLRAISILAVVLYHADLGCGGGYVGVDIFFVISGYLITGLILRDLDKGRFQLVEFWTRRVRRIFPALLVMLVACLVAGWFLLFQKDFEQLARSVVAQVLLSSNFYFWNKSGYFADSTELMPLLHTWSLAVEEQFYFFFPFLLLALHRYSRRGLIVVSSLIGAASLGLCVYCSYAHPSAAFYFLPTRAWELLIGALPAMLSTSPAISRGWKEVLAWAGLLAIGYAVFGYNKDTVFPGFAAVVPCAGAACLVWVNGGSSVTVGKILAWPPLVFIGLISYSFYLWHWPLLAYGHYWSTNPDQVLSLPLRWMIVWISFVLAILSWRWIETPFRRGTLFRTRLGILSFAGVSTAALVLAGFYIILFQGLPDRLPTLAADFADSANDMGIRQELDLNDITQEHFVELGGQATQEPPKIFVWGDSHAMAILSVIDSLCREHHVRGLAATHSSTAPLLDYESHGTWSLKEQSIPYNDAVLKFIQKSKIPDVILAGEWGRGYDDGQELRPHLDKTISALKASGARVWIMRQVPRPGKDVPRTLALEVMLQGDSQETDFNLDAYHADLAHAQGLFESLSGSGVAVLDPVPFFINPQGRLIVESNGRALYFDDQHLSSIGALRLKGLFEPIFGTPSSRDLPQVPQQ